MIFSFFLQIEGLEAALTASANASGDIVSSQANLKLVELEAAHRQQLDELKRKLEDARGELKAIRDMRVMKRGLWFSSNWIIIIS